MNFRQSMRGLVPAAGLALATLSPALAESVDLSPKFEVGQETSYLWNSEITGQTEMNGQKFPTNGNQLFELTRKVVEAGDQGAKVEMTFGRVNLAMDMGMMSFEFDSNTPEAEDAGNQMARFIRPIVGQTVIFHISANGTIEDVEVPEGVVTPANPFAAQLLDKDALKSNFGLLFTMHKEPAVAEVGESWEVTTKSPMQNQPGKLSINQVYTLKSIDGDTANIGVTGDMDVEVEEGAMAEVKIKESSMKGTIDWDTSRGELASLDVTQSITQDIEMQGMQMMSTVSNALSVKRTK